MRCPSGASILYWFARLGMPLSCLPVASLYGGVRAGIREEMKMEKGKQEILEKINLLKSQGCSDIEAWRRVSFDFAQDVKQAVNQGAYSRNHASEILRSVSKIEQLFLNSKK
jgi:hypothetical protein